MTQRMLIALGALLSVGVIATSFRGTTSNCGGNSAALAQVHAYALFAAVSGAEELSSESRQYLARLARSHWLPNARFLVSTVPMHPHEPRRIVVICDTAYRNVPKLWFGTAPPTHAVGYSDGSTGLLSKRDFAAINWSQFAAIEDLYPATK